VSVAVRLGGVVLLGLTLLPALAGAAPGDPGAIVFPAPDGLRRIDPETGASVVIRAPECIQDAGTARCFVGTVPSWSPDGRRIAFVDRSTLRVIDEDGANERTLFTGVIVELFTPKWSPDGTRLAFLGRRFRDGPAYVYVIRVDGGVPTELTPSTSQARGPVSWSPDGAQLAVAEWSPSPATFQIFVTAVDGSARRQVTAIQPYASAAYPVWSPDGSRIAFARLGSASGDGVATIGADGSGETTVLRAPPQVSARPVQWSTDGRVLMEQFVQSSYQVGGTHLYTARGDGTELRRLTAVGFNRTPVLSPDGSALAFTRNEVVSGNVRTALWTANGDGTCERSLHLGSTPDWRPGSTPTPVTCTQARLSMSESAGIVDGRFDLLVTNDGTEPLRGMQLIAEVPRGQSLFLSHGGAACPSDGVTARCALPELRRGEVATIHVDVKARVLTLRQGGQYRDIVTSTFALEPYAERFESRVLLQTCSTEDAGAGRIRGTYRSETICGRTGEDVISGDWGRDLIRGGRGNDRIVAGFGADIVNAGPGNDVVLAAPGNDRIYARDRARDRISCGSGRDVVVADRGDRVARDCERVSRR
jgi:Tol biopolymer transport system component